MRILALTDIHASYKKAEEIITKTPSDVVVIGGDLTTVGSVKEARNAVERFQSMTQTILCVAGNMDSAKHDELFDQLGVSINGCGRVIDNIGFFGVSASPHSPLRTPYELSEEELGRRIASGFKEVAGSSIKVFVSHAPPFDTRTDIIHSGVHVGSRAVRDFVDMHQPDVVICGHIHESRGQDRLGKARIVNCGPAASGFFVTVEIIGPEIAIAEHSLQTAPL